MFVQTFRRMISIVTVLSIVAAVALAPNVARADDAESVTVTATISSLVASSITLCDTSAAFGTGLDANATPPTNTGDSIYSVMGNAEGGQGAYYQWTPTCESGSFITVVAGNPWDGTVCADIVSNDSSLGLDNLRYSPTSYVGFSYNTINTDTHLFPTCAAPGNWLSTIDPFGTAGTPGTHSFNAYYFLRVDRDATSGSFEATTTWTVSG